MQLVLRLLLLTLPILFLPLLRYSDQLDMLSFELIFRRPQLLIFPQNRIQFIPLLFNLLF